MHKCVLPFIFQRNLLITNNKTTKYLPSPKSIVLYSNNYSSENNDNLKSNRYLKEMKKNQNTHNRVITFANKKNINKDYNKKKEEEFRTINLIMPQNNKEGNINEKMNLSQCFRDEPTNQNSTFLTRCYITGKDNEEKTKFELSNSRNISDIGSLLKQLEINKEKINNERQEIAKMIKSTKKTQNTILGLTSNRFGHYRKSNTRIGLNKY